MTTTMRLNVAARLTDTRRQWTGLAWLAGTGLGYAACILLLAAGGDVPGDMAPWLAIPRDAYFWWEAAFIGPVVVAGGLLAAAGVYLLGRAAGGTGTFDDTLALLGPAIAVCTTFTLVPDLVIGILLNSGAMSPQRWMADVTHPSATLGLVWTYLTLYLVAFLVAFPYATAAVHRLGRWRSVAVGWAGFAIYQGFLFIFVR
jgi:hypothetical protein